MAVSNQCHFAVFLLAVVAPRDACAPTAKDLLLHRLSYRSDGLSRAMRLTIALFRSLCCDCIATLWNGRDSNPRSQLCYRMRLIRPTRITKYQRMTHPSPPFRESEVPSSYSLSSFVLWITNHVTPASHTNPTAFQMSTFPFLFSCTTSKQGSTMKPMARMQQTTHAPALTNLNIVLMIL